MTAEQAYRYGFLVQCAEDGLDEAATAARAKLAFSLSDLPGPALATLSDLPGPALATLAAATFGVGLAGGAGARRLAQPDFRVKDLQRKEIADLYTSFADDLERKNKADLTDTAEA